MKMKIVKFPKNHENWFKGVKKHKTHVITCFSYLSFVFLEKEKGRTA